MTIQPLSPNIAKTKIPTTKLKSLSVQCMTFSQPRSSFTTSCLWFQSQIVWVLFEPMAEASTCWCWLSGIDAVDGSSIAKSVFQVHGIDRDGNVVVRRQLKRRYVLTFFAKLPPCLCASSHYWSRELQALGHTVRLMPPA